MELSDRWRTVDNEGNGGSQTGNPVVTLTFRSGSSALSTWVEPCLRKREPVEANPIDAEARVRYCAVEFDRDVNRANSEGLGVIAGCYFKPRDRVLRYPHAPVGSIVLHMQVVGSRTGNYASAATKCPPARVLRAERCLNGLERCRRRVEFNAWSNSIGSRAGSRVHEVQIDSREIREAGHAELHGAGEWTSGDGSLLNDEAGPTCITEMDIQPVWDRGVHVKADKGRGRVFAISHCRTGTGPDRLE